MIKVSSLFTQVLSLVQRNDFERSVQRHQAQRGAKGFSSWSQFVAMMFCQLATATGKLVHLGLKTAPARSTLAYANEHRSYRVFKDVFDQLPDQARSQAALKKWKFRRAKGAVKLHLQLDHQGYLPTWALITDGKPHDVKVAQMLKFAPGTIVAMDRGYVDYGLFSQHERERGTDPDLDSSDSISI